MNENNKTNPPPTQFEKLAAAGEKAALYMRIIEDFAPWVTANMMSGIDVEECTSIFEDYINSNEHIIQRIKKIRPSP